MRHSTSGGRSPQPGRAYGPARRRLLIVVSVALGLAGFSALVYEVAWTRVLGLMLGGSTYTFSLMLLAFLSASPSAAG